MLAPDERLARIRLARTEGIGPVGFSQLLARHGDARRAFAALDAQGRRLADPGLVAAEVEAAQALGGFHLVLGDPGYPNLLAALADPPPLLVAAGDAGIAARPVVALVGARNASAAGRGLARELAEGLGAAGFVVASGLARGIDAAAHRGAIGTGTIGCVAGGIDIAYPPEHAELQAEIAAGGLLLSEVPPGTEPQARHFPRRNRLIAGVACGVVVIEAAPGSGSLITARLAAEAGREVMAVPGHPADPRSRGGNGLIRDGAVLVESAEDVVAVLKPFALVAPEPQVPRRRRPERPVTPRPVGALEPRGEAALLDLLTTSGVTLDELVRASGLGAADLQAQLADLELEGRVIRMTGGRIARAAR